MAITKRLVKAAGLTAGVIGIVTASASDSVVGRAARRLADRLGRDVRYAAASAPGILYRLAGRFPDPNVSDDVLTDRVRSSPDRSRSDSTFPACTSSWRTTSRSCTATWPNEWAACAIEGAIMRISGVKGVESHLHPGLVAGDARPSQGAAVQQPPSAALSALLDATAR